MSIELKCYNVEYCYFDVVVYNGVVYVVGQVFEIMFDVGIVEQMVEVFVIIDCVLVVNGSDKMCILMCQIFLKDISEIGEMNKVWDQWVVVDFKNLLLCVIVEVVLVNLKYCIEIVVMVVQKN